MTSMARLDLTEEINDRVWKSLSKPASKNIDERMESR